MTPEEQEEASRRSEAHRIEEEKKWRADLQAKWRDGYTSLSREDQAACRFEKLMVVPHNRETLSVLQTWNPEKTTKGAVFYGDVGTGKTMICKCLINKWASETYRCKIIDVPQFCQLLKDSMDKPDGSVQATMDRFIRYNMLVLDDLGTEKSSDWVDERLFSLIDNRLQHGRHTFVTTNLEINDLKKRYGDRLIDRLTSFNRFFEIKGPSMRQFLAKKDSW